MSFEIIQTVPFPSPSYFNSEDNEYCNFEDLDTIGTVSTNSKIAWKTKGPFLEIRNAATGHKISSYIFGRNTNETTIIVGVEELKRDSGQYPFLIVGLDKPFGSTIAIYGISCSKVLRAIHIEEKITSLHIIDFDNDENRTSLDSSDLLKYFDGIVVAGTIGGNVYLIDTCRTICEDAILSYRGIRNENNPCQINLINISQLSNIKKYLKHCKENGKHLAIHLNVVSNAPVNCFILKGEDNEDRIHVNLSEVEISSLHFSPQIASLLIGYNFGAFQLWDLKSLLLVYTSEICKQHLSVSHFTLQEPADDPKACCYLWVGYSHNVLFHSTFPYAIMFSLYYGSKKCNDQNKYGYLYNKFQHCTRRFKIKLNDVQHTLPQFDGKGGSILTFQSFNIPPMIKDLHSLSLCVVGWLMWSNENEINSTVMVFDLNQWYKEQMPGILDESFSSYLSIHHLNVHLLDLKLIENTVKQFIGIQRPEMHFCPSALSYDLLSISAESVVKIRSKSLQELFIEKLISEKQYALVEPSNCYKEIENLSLTPLFWDANNDSIGNNLHIFQCETILSVALEQKIIGFICECAQRLSSESYSCDLQTILSWAFQRGITLKNSCDRFCKSLFDYSGNRLDNNTITILNNSISQIKNLCTIYRYILKDLKTFLTDEAACLEEQKLLENVLAYYEALLWMMNLGLLPESSPNRTMNLTNYNNQVCSPVPYYAQKITDFYNKRRAEMRLLSHDTFVEMDCLLYIDNLINMNGENLKEFWQKDCGSGLYPPPSIQSLLFTYLVNGSDLIFKHSLVTYTLLDIAKTLDQNNHRVKDFLLKFPQFFHLSQSHIKIIQAFWYLDQQECETAVELILAPIIATADLAQWHHSIMLRSLLLQKEYNLAFQYIQIRKPSIEQDKDLFTVISLLVNKNMIDEAFTFQQQNMSKLSLLHHIFNECNKNGKLHSLLYRCFDADEEKALFNYLQKTKIPNYEDLKIFYFLLRSRFLEAFEIYSSSRKANPEHLGLTGQKLSTTTDSIVKMFKNLLPDINRNLVEIVRKERTNLWKPVKKPTPLSVFVHNTNSRPQYKSSLIFAALAKAKETDNIHLDDSENITNIVTEETPFLRTPTILRKRDRADTRVITTKIIQHNEFGEEFGPSPPKKIKLTPSHSRNLYNNANISSKQEQISTPIISRKKSFDRRAEDDIILPHSILKTNLFAENISTPHRVKNYQENLTGNSTLNLTPRKSILRTPNKSQQHVQFNDMSSLSNSIPYEEHNLSDMPSEIQSKSSSTNEEEFYSPNSSFMQKDEISLATDTTKENNTLNNKVDFEKCDSDIEHQDIEDNHIELNKKQSFSSPSRRKSYKRLFNEVPIRSSPRLSQKLERKDSMPEESNHQLEQSDITKSSGKLKCRRSLSRIAIEKSSLFSSKTSTLMETSEEFFQNETRNISANDSLAEFFKKYESKESESDSGASIDNEDNTKVENSYKANTGSSVKPKPLEETKILSSSDEDSVSFREGSVQPEITEAKLLDEYISSESENLANDSREDEQSIKNTAPVDRIIEISSSSSDNNDNPTENVYENLNTFSQLEYDSFANKAFAQFKSNRSSGEDQLSNSHTASFNSRIESSSSHNDSMEAYTTNSLASRTETELTALDEPIISEADDSATENDTVARELDEEKDEESIDQDVLDIKKVDSSEERLVDGVIPTDRESLFEDSKKQEDDESNDDLQNQNESGTDNQNDSVIIKESNEHRQSVTNARQAKSISDCETVHNLELQSTRSISDASEQTEPASPQRIVKQNKRATTVGLQCSLKESSSAKTPSKAKSLRSRKSTGLLPEKSVNSTPDLKLNTIKKTYPKRRRNLTKSTDDSDATENLSTKSNQSSRPNSICMDSVESMNSRNCYNDLDDSNITLPTGKNIRKRKHSESSNNTTVTKTTTSTSDIQDITLKGNDIIKPVRRLRSASADQALSINKNRRITRSYSNDIDLSPVPENNKQILTPINNLQKKLVEEVNVPTSKSTLRTYASSRRLTRRQAKLLESMKLKVENMEEENEPTDIENSSNVTNSPTADSIESASSSRQTRSNSAPPRSLRQSTPKRNVGKKLLEPASPSTSSGIRSRLRSASIESVDSSISSISPKSIETKNKRTRQPKQQTKEKNIAVQAQAPLETARRKTRVRSSSVSSNESIKSNASSSRKQSIVSISSKTALPEIREENENEDVIPPSSYHLRKRN